MKTPAAILIESHRPLVVDEVEVPRPRYGQVLVEVKVTRICGSQIGEIDAVKGPDKYLPHLLGHEGGGIVLETGPEVKQVKAGDRVVLHWRPGRGVSAGASVYDWKGRRVNAGSITTFQRYCVVSEDRLTPVPVDTDFELCALLADTLTTGFGAVTRNARVEIGESVVVIGVGGIGLGTVLGAHLAGAHPVIAADIHEHKLTKAREYGATHTVNTSQENLVDAVQRILDGAADAVFDGTGNPSVIEQAWKITSAKGRLTLVGVMRHDQQFSFNTLPLHFGKVLTASEGGMSHPSIDIPRLLRMIGGGRFDARCFVTHRSSLEQVNDAITAMRAGKSIHTMIHF